MNKGIKMFVNHKRRLKKPALFMLCMVFLMTSLFVAKIVNADSEIFYAKDFVNDPTLAYMNVVFEYGNYPQSKVTDDTLISNLELETPVDEVVNYNSNRYYKMNDGEYYLFEPIRWRVLSIDKTKDELFVLSEEILDDIKWQPAWGEVYWNENPLVRNFINGEFYNRAFSDLEKTNIIEKEYPLGSSGYDGEPIADKITCLSYDDIRSTNGVNYGFTSNRSDSNAVHKEDSYWYILEELNNRSACLTDYAMVNYGARLDNILRIENSIYNNRILGIWWTKSLSSRNTARYISEQGNAATTYYMDYTLGIRPAVTFKYSELKNIEAVITQTNDRDESYSDTTSFVGYQYDGSCLLDESPTNLTIETVQKAKAYYTNGTYYYVSFDANGGETELDNNVLEVTPSSSITLPNVTRKGYTFKGWYTATTGGTKKGNAGASYTPKATEKIYAQWELIPPFYAKDFVNDSTLGYMNVVFDFGEFPQSKVDDSTLISTLNTKVPSSNVVTDDSGTRYFKKDDNEYYKYEPIEWRILSIDDTNGEVFAISEKNIYYGDWETTRTINKWAESSIARDWINGYFYDEAFNALEKNTIVPKVYPTYNNDGDGIEDKVTFLSLAEIEGDKAVNFGFINNTSATETKGTATGGITPINTEYTNRLSYFTDYAFSYKNDNKYVCNIQTSPNYQKVSGGWLTRTKISATISLVTIYGEVSECSYGPGGYRPAITLKLSDMLDEEVRVRQATPRNTSSTDTKRLLGYKYNGGSISDSSPSNLTFSNIRKLKAIFGHAYSITFDANEGTLSDELKNAEVNEGNNCSLPEPTRDGYTFIGWYTGKNSGTLRGGAGDSYKPTKSETLYARWESNDVFYAKKFVNDPLLGYMNVVLEFGEYPQTKVKDSSLINELNLETASNSVVTYNSKKYFKKAGSEYYLYEPIKWRILSIDETNDQVFLLSQFTLNAQKWDSQKTTNNKWNDNPPIRNWINETFYNDAFNSDEKDAIVEKEYPLGSSGYDGTGIDDKVTLLSCDEMQGSKAVDFGFVSGFDKYELRNPDSAVNGAYLLFTEYTNRLGYITDYAFSYMPSNTGYGESQLENSPNYKVKTPAWWSRSRASAAKAYYAGTRSQVYGDNDTTLVLGVRPAITLKLSELDDKELTVYQTWARNETTTETISFVGYSFDESALTSSPEFDLDFSNIKKLKAYFSDGSVNYVSYDANGGTKSIEENFIEVAAGSEIELPDATREGYEFLGWFTSATGGTKIGDASDTYMPTSSLTLYAQWENEVYEIILNNQGGDSESYDYWVKYGVGNFEDDECITPITKVSIPEYEGYTFKGYFEGANGTGTKYVDADGTIISDGTTFLDHGTIYASWELTTYTIECNLNGGDLLITNPTTYDITTNDIVLNNPIKTGYNFDGWSGTGIDGTSKTVTIEKGSTGNRSYAANWTKSTTVSYAVNHFLMKIDGTYELSETDNLSGTTDDTLTLENLADSYTGFTYLRGKAGAATTSVPSDSEKDLTTTILADGSRVINLYYERNSHTVTVTPDAGCTVTGDGTYYFGESVTVKVTTKDGYTFANITGTYSSSLNEYTFQMADSDVSLNANTTLDEYTITYILNNGTVSGNNPETYNVNSNTITLINPTRDGCIFEGWSGPGIPNLSTNVTIPTGSKGNRTYIASWVNISTIIYDITYDLDGGNDPHNQTTYNELQETFILNNPTKKGFVFTGWTGSNGTVPETKVSIEKGSTGDKNFKANWTPLKVNVVIDGDLTGGDVTPVGDLTIDFENETFKTLSITVNSEFKAVVYENNEVKTELSTSGSYTIQNLDKLKKHLTVKVEFDTNKPSGGKRKTEKQPVVIEPPKEEKEILVYDAYMNGYQDKTFIPKGYVTREEVATLLARTYSDFEEDEDYSSYNKFKDSIRWSKNYISFGEKKGIWHGYEDGSFGPTRYMTRAELAVLALNIIADKNLEFEKVNKVKFTDVKGRWFEKEVNKLASLGILTGYEDGTFRGDRKATRVEIAIVMNRLDGRSQIDSLPDEDIQKINDMFTDINTKSWYYKDVALATIEHTLEITKNSDEK